MRPVFKKLFFLSLYLGVDCYYVMSSHAIYQQAVFSIANHDMPAAERQLSILFAYGSMALGWYFLALPALEYWNDKLYRPLAGLLTGLIFGLSIIGTFNFTLNLMFEGWQGAILKRDLLWGVSWSTISIFLYSIFSSPSKKQRFFQAY